MSINESLYCRGLCDHIQRALLRHHQLKQTLMNLPRTSIVLIFTHFIGNPHPNLDPYLPFQLQPNVPFTFKSILKHYLYFSL